MEELMENEAFANGIIVGVSLHQQRVIAAHERKDPVKIGDKLYFIQDGKERLEQVLDEICK